MAILNLKRAVLLMSELRCVDRFDLVLCAPPPNVILSDLYLRNLIIQIYLNQSVQRRGVRDHVRLMSEN